MPAELGELKEDDVLKQEALPSPETWARARTMAEEIFGLQQLSTIATASSVGIFSNKVKAWISDQRALAHLGALQSALVPVLATFTTEPENSARMITARETATWLKKLDKHDGAALVELVVAATFSSAPAAVARGLATSENLAACLTRNEWLEPIERAGQLGESFAGSVAALTNRIATALRHDELVQPLRETLESASKSAHELIFEAARGSSPSPTPPLPPTPPVEPSRPVDDIPLPDPLPPPLRTKRRRSQVSGDHLPEWMPPDSAPDLLMEVTTSNQQKMVVTPTLARLLQLDPNATLSGDGRTLTLPKWNLVLNLED